VDLAPRPLTRPPSRGQLIALDCLAALAYTNVLLTLTRSDVAARPAWLSYAIAGGIGLPIAVRRLWPVPAFGVAFVVSVLAVLLDVARDNFVAAAFVLYVVALTQPSRRWVPTAAIGALSVAGMVLLSVGGTSIPAASRAAPVSRPADRLALLASSTTLLGGAWTAGRAVRERRAYALRSAEQVAERAVAAERLRIARELHDIVAHSMSLIAVKAGVANHVVRARPQEAHDALGVIETTSRKALAELRHLLGVLRAGDIAGQARVDTAPAPGPAELAELAERAAVGGIEVDLHVRGAQHLPEGVGLSVYRIVQEALTNVVKHAAPARCRVVVAADARAVTVDVTDDGPAAVTASALAAGHGLVGIRERVALYDGTMRVGPRPQGGFALSVRLPYESGGPPP
jgi:signal transduction histidine kinase